MIHRHAGSIAAMLAACLAAVTLAACGGGGSSPPPSGQLAGYIQGTVNPEDLVLIPGTNFVVASTDKTPGKSKPAYLYLIDSVTGVAKPVQATIAPVSTAGDPSCRPLQLTDLAMSGLGMAKAGDGSLQLLAVNRGERMSIEFFAIDVSGAEPKFTWTGCLVMPDKAFPNDVVSTGNGGLAVTVSYETDNTRLMEQLENREKTGYLLVWTKQAGFTRVPGSELSFNNGLEIDPDGKFFYLAAWGSQQLLRLPTTPANGTPLLVDLGLRPDNLNWSRAGTLIVAGHIQSPTQVFTCVGESVDVCPVPFKVVEVDPRTLTILRVLVDGTAADTYAGATSAIEVGNEIWAGSFRYGKIARYTR